VIPVDFRHFSGRIDRPRDSVCMLTAEISAPDTVVVLMMSAVANELAPSSALNRVLRNDLPEYYTGVS
jgi:hypothetical protein